MQWISLFITSPIPKSPSVVLFPKISQGQVQKYSLLWYVAWREEQWFLVITESCKYALEKKKLGTAKSFTLEEEKLNRLKNENYSHNVFQPNN